MIDKTLVGYALLNCFSKDGKSILDAHVPLVVSCLFESQYEKVNRDDIKRMLNDKYGFESITLGAIDSIMQIMVRDNLLKKERGVYWFNRDELSPINIANSQDGLLSRFGGIVIRIQTFGRERFNLFFSSDEIEKCFLSFLQQHDVEVALSDEHVYAVLNKRKPDKTCRYVLSRFLLEAKESSPEIIKDVTAFAKGHSLASVVSLDSFDNYGGKLDKVHIAIDSPIIFNMLGLNGFSNQALTDELISILKEKNASFIIFRQNYDEVLNTLNDAEWRLRTHSFDYDKSSRVLKYAFREHKNADYLQLKIQQVDQLLMDHNIVISNAPDIPDNYQEIDVNLLRSIIVNRYTHNGELELKEYQEDLINTDVDTISYVFRLRGKTPAINIKKSSAILLTTNKAISFASRHPGLSSVHHTIPPCVTDVFLSTLMWVISPKKNSDINEKLLMSDCYSSILLDDEILKSFYNDIKRMNEENRITKEQVALVLSSNLTISLLEQKTYNDFDRYSDSTPEEIIREIEDNLTKDNTSLKNKLSNHDTKYRRIAKVLSSVVYYFVWIILAVLFIWIRFIDIHALTGWKSLIAYAILLLSILWGLLTNLGIIKPKKNIIVWLENRIYEKINNYFDQDD